MKGRHLRPRWRGPLTTLAAMVAGGLAAAVALGVPAEAGPRPSTAAQNLGDPDYGVCRGTDPRCYHDWGNVDLSRGVKVLLYTRTAGPRHANLGPPLAPGLDPPLTDANAAQRGIIALGA